VKEAASDATVAALGPAHARKESGEYAMKRCVTATAGASTIDAVDVSDGVGEPVPPRALAVVDADGELVADGRLVGESDG